jgi:hypothetical protein
MTNYSAWDSKASALAREAEEEEKKEKEENDKALGLEGGPKGPPTAKADEEIKELGEHSDKRKEFIDWSKQREVTQTHGPQDEPIILEGDEVKTKALKLIGSEDVTYVIPEGSGIVKLSLDRCKKVKIQVTGTIMTSTIEACRCEDVSIELSVPIGTFQVDECTSPVLIVFAERDHIGCVYHQNSPGLSVGIGNAETVLGHWHSNSIVKGEHELVGKSDAVQHFSKIAHGGLLTNVVRRGEGEFPLDLPGDQPSGGYRSDQPEPEAAPAAEERRLKAEMKRQAGNEMFRANDFMQAAMEYTSALELDPSISALYANRSQCWLKLGNHEKSLEDAVRCTEVEPSNAKGWFRKGMSLHAMKRFPEAIPALLEAEKIEPSNKQVGEAIKMAQLMARQQASSS